MTPLEAPAVAAAPRTVAVGGHPDHAAAFAAAAPPGVTLVSLADAVRAGVAFDLVYFAEAGPATGAHALEALQPVLAAGLAGRCVGVVRLGGTFGLVGDESEEVFSAAVAGVFKTVAREYPACRVHVLDGSPQAAWDVMQAGGPLPTELGFDGNQWWQLNLRSLPASRGGAARFGPEDVVLATGGARGVTAAVAEAFARRHGCRLALVGRTAIGDPEPPDLDNCNTVEDVRRRLVADGTSRPPKELRRLSEAVVAARTMRAHLRRLSETGVVARYYAADATDLASLRATVGQVRADLGEPTVLLHGAGVLRDARIANKTAASFDEVVRTKVTAAADLDAWLDTSRLKAVQFFSSTTARLGRVGQVDYAAANEVLNKLACRYRRRLPNAVVHAVNWGPWAGGMVTPDLERQFAAEGVGLIPLDRGGAVACDLLERSAPAAEVVVLAEATAPPDDSMRVVSVEAYPELAGHVIDGRPVVPAAMLVNWLAEAVPLPDGPVQLDEVEVFRPLAVPAGGAVSVKAARVAGGTVTLVAGGPPHAPYCRGSVGAGGALAPAPLPPARKLRSLDRPAYDGALFHRDHWQCLRNVRLGEGTATALVAVTGWGGPWRVDPLLADAAFQLFILLSDSELGFGCLPMGVGRLWCRGGPPPAAASVSVQVSERGEGVWTGDAAAVGEDGAVYYTMTGVRLVHHARLREAFGRNRVSATAGAA